ncbi:MAG: ferredoxin [Deltaproteobacteria bacterium]|nr:ferredoxin [Deltaproteobacteria bacterium]
MEVQALRAALGAQETAPAAAAAPKRRGRKAEKAEKAAPVARIEVREEDCIGCGTCVDFAPTVFAIKNNGRAHVISQDGPAEAIEDAIRGCPTSCIVRVT